MVLMGRAPHRPPLGLEGARDVAIAERVMAETGILELAARRITELSGGEPSASSSRALSRKSRASCCSTSRPPTSTSGTRSRSSTSSPR
jgi:iron complex transport system ATP-binding protein